jgi:DNA-binding NarL/FixJ family response regulator
MTITIVLADDQPLLRQGFRLVLASQADMDVIGEAGDGAEAVRLTRDLGPDVVLMDVRMPKMDGIEATRRIVDSGSASRVVILTTFDVDEYAYAGLRAGASGFLLKDVMPMDLVNSIRVVAAGEAVIAPTVTRRLLDTFAHRLPRSDEPDRFADPLALLTPREREVFAELASGLTNGEIAARLVLSEATVKTHVARILDKLELRDRVQAVIFAYEQGINSPTGGTAD